jgi:hypothetical protein
MAEISSFGQLVMAKGISEGHFYAKDPNNDPAVLAAIAAL